MSWEIAVAGTFHSDDVTTPRGRFTSPGGSAVYFALAAARYARVHVNGIAGPDTAGSYRELLRGLPVDLSGLAVGDGPTFVWHAVHDFDRWTTASESADQGCEEQWSGNLDAASRRAEVLFLASLSPDKQLRAADQSAARLIGSDSMTVFMADRAAAVRRVAMRSDVLFLNTMELATLTGDDDWRRAAASLFDGGRLRAVVVKRGPLGAACVTREGIIEQPAPPVDQIVDPTGAGDALAGGFLGLCARVQRDDDEMFAAALAEGVSCAADAIASFGVTALRAHAHPAGARGPGDV